jgi:exopolyphosphatase/pppGpp-phosphohydrolase
MRWHVEHLWNLSFAKRQEIVGLPKKRADVILMGTVIYEAVMEIFTLDELRVTTRGLRYAVLMDNA